MKRRAILFTFLTVFSAAGCYDKNQLAEKDLKIDAGNDYLMTKGESQYRKHCMSCHFVKGIGDKNNVAPSLEDLAMRMDGTMIRESIIEPDRIIKEGYKKGIMPKNFSSLMNEEEMDALIYYITN